MQSGYEFNSLEFITAGGLVSIAVAVTLLVMSVASWYFIIVKTVQAYRAKKAFRTYANQFWSANSLTEATRKTGASALAALAKQAISAAEHHQLYVSKNADKVPQDEFVARAMNRSIADESAKLESGLTVLASVGSVSPFVGLFGTVWGIYHALASISQSGQATLDKVAGPVGEALIMTALGLVVAIPAVLAYNALVRGNRVLLGELEKFGYELHTLLTTGKVMQSNIEQKTPAPAKKHIKIVEVPA